MNNPRSNRVAPPTVTLDLKASGATLAGTVTGGGGGDPTTTEVDAKRAK